MRGPMKLINDHRGQMECRICGSVHWANQRHGGGLYRGSYQCSNDACPSNERDGNGKKIHEDWRELSKVN